MISICLPIRTTHTHTPIQPHLRCSILYRSTFYRFHIFSIIIFLPCIIITFSIYPLTFSTIDYLIDRSITNWHTSTTISFACIIYTISIKFVFDFLNTIMNTKKKNWIQMGTSRSKVRFQCFQIFRLLACIQQSIVLNIVVMGKNVQESRDCWFVSSVLWRTVCFFLVVDHVSRL